MQLSIVKMQITNCSNEHSSFFMVDCTRKRTWSHFAFAASKEKIQFYYKGKLIMMRERERVKWIFVLIIRSFSIELPTKHNIPIHIVLERVNLQGAQMIDFEDILGINRYFLQFCMGGLLRGLLGMSYIWTWLWHSKWVIMRRNWSKWDLPTRKLREG